MPCEPYREMLIDHIADELAEEEKILLEQHLAECSGCTAEERQLRRAIEATTPADVGEVHPATETSLLATFREHAAPPSEHGKQDSEIGRKRAENLWQKIRRSGSFLRALRRPMPSYATVLLLFAAIAAGFWMGPSDQPGSLQRGSNEPIRPAIHQPIRDTDALEDALAVVRIPDDDSLARSSGSFRQDRSALRFATTPSDAMELVWVTLRDTL